MITITTKNETFIDIKFSDIEGEFGKIYEYFSIDIPGAKHTPQYKMGLIDGKENFLRFYEDSEDTCYMMFGLKQKLLAYCEQSNIEYVDNTIENKSNIKEESLKKFIDMLDLKYNLYNHQFKAVYNILKNKNGIQLSSVGSGKSLILYVVFRYLLFLEQKGLLVVPNIGLVFQMFEDFKEYFSYKEEELINSLENENDEIKRAELQAQLRKIKDNRIKTKCVSIEENVALIKAGTDKNTNHPFKISTYQSLCIAQERVNEEYFKNIDALMVDECHKSSSKSLKDIISASSNAKLKIGVTGSLSDNYLENITIEGLFGAVNKIITLSEMIKLGLATKIIVTPIILKYPKELVKIVRKAKSYASEDKLIRTQIPRNRFIAKLASKIKNKNSMIVYKNSETCKMILEEYHKIKFHDIEYKYRDYTKLNDRNVCVISGATKANVREDFRSNMSKSKNNTMFGVSSIIATGLNIPSLEVTILECIEKSKTLVEQALGRGSRLCEGKTHSQIIDIVDDLTYTTRYGNEYPNYKMQHFNERLDIYIKNGCEIQEPMIVKLNYDEFKDLF